MSNPAPEWSPEQVGALRMMAGEQKLPARKIARALTAQFGIIRSHSAVLGKLHRLREEETRPPGAPVRRKRGERETSSEYVAWRGMRARCSNPKHPSWRRYGGRGITVCERWANSFEAFLVDMGQKPSPELALVRINKEFEPGNCRWATRVEAVQPPPTIASR
jgi:hypothetical protein